MKVMIPNSCNISFNFNELKKDKIKYKRTVKFYKNSTKEAMFVFIGQHIWIVRKPKLEEKKSIPFKNATRRCPTLKEL